MSSSDAEMLPNQVQVDEYACETVPNGGTVRIVAAHTGFGGARG
jgi:hypothetical protein